jgi:hypothetical protein
MSCPNGYYSSKYRDRIICKRKPVKKVAGKGTKKEFTDLFRDNYRKYKYSNRVPRALVECTYSKYLANNNLTIKRLKEYGEKEWLKLISVAEKVCIDYKIPRAPSPIIQKILDNTNNKIMANLSSLALVSIENRIQKKFIKRIDKEIKELAKEEEYEDLGQIGQSEEEEKLQNELTFQLKLIREIDDKITALTFKPNAKKEDYMEIVSLSEKSILQKKYAKAIAEELGYKEEMAPETKKEEEKREVEDNILIEDITDIIIENLGNQEIKGTFAEFELLFKQNYAKYVSKDHIPILYLKCAYNSYINAPKFTIKLLNSYDEKKWVLFFNRISEICKG